MQLSCMTQAITRVCRALQSAMQAAPACTKEVDPVYAAGELSQQVGRQPAPAAKLWQTLAGLRCWGDMGTPDRPGIPKACSHVTMSWEGLLG